jgi:hypothetical protein
VHGYGAEGLKCRGLCRARRSEESSRIVRIYPCPRLLIGMEIDISILDLHALDGALAPRPPHWARSAGVGDRDGSGS